MVDDRVLKFHIQISQNVFELEPSYLVCWLGLRRRLPD